MNNRARKAAAYIKAKGFYIALAVCIVGATAAAWTTANRTINEIGKNNSSVAGDSGSSYTPPPASSSSREETRWEAPSSQPAAQSTPDIAKPSPSSISPAPPSSSRPSVQKPVASSSSQAPRPAQQTSSYTRPVAGSEILAPYSDGKLVKNQTLNVWRTHDGADYKAATGDSVRAVASGKVLSVINDPLWGGTVAIEHDGGCTSFYSGLTPDAKLKAGAAVEQGQVIGEVAQIPAEISMESHLHFAVKRGKDYVDPETLFV